jgi:glutamine synthetase
VPRTLEEALDRFVNCTQVRAVLGKGFFNTFASIKTTELEAYRAVISSWERDHLLLKV